MCKKLFSLIVLLTFTFRLFAQNQISGKLVDTVNNNAVLFATIAIKDYNEVIKYSTSSGNEGHFAFNILPGNYKLLITCIGYFEKIIPFVSSSNSPIIDLGDIKLEKSTKSLKEVTIQGQKSAYGFSPGKIIYNVGNDLRTQGRNGFDILRYTPLISISGGESIRLKGQDNFKILLNGKSNPALSTNIVLFLQSLDSKDIEKIEVVTTPSAKYSAEGIGGIINIVTKKINVDGVFGGTGGGIDTYGSTFINGNLSGRDNKFGYSIIATGSIFRNGIYNYSLQQIHNNRFENYLGSTLPKRNLVNTVTQLSYEFSPNNLLNIDLNTYIGNGIIRQDFLSNRINLTSINKLRNTNYGLGGGFEHKFTETSSLILSYKYNSQEDKNSVDFPTTHFNTENVGSTRENILQFDYVINNIEVGARTSLRNFKSVIQDNAQFNFKQNIYAGYFSYSKKYKSLNFQAGARGELSYYNNSSIAQTYIDKKFNIFPSITIDKTFPIQKINVGFGYNSRISRPQIYYLNPFQNVSNPYFTNSGNTALMPEISHNFEFRISKEDKKGNNYIVMLSYIYNKNAIHGLTYFQSDTSVNSQYINLNNQQTLGLNTSLSITLFKYLNFNFSSNLYYVLMKEIFDQTSLANSNYLKNKGVYGSFEMDFSTKIFKDYAVSVSNNYSIRDIYLQGYGSAFFYQDISITKSIFNKKLRLSAAIRQPFLGHYTFKQTYPDLYQQSSNSTVQRRAYFGIRYSFGKPKKANQQTKKKAASDDKKTKNILENIK